MSQLTWSEILSTEDLEVASRSIMTKVNSVKNEFSKSVTHSRKKLILPWLNEQIWSLMKQRDYALKTAIKSGLAHHRRTFQQLRNKVVN